MGAKVEKSDKIKISVKGKDAKTLKSIFERISNNNIGFNSGKLSESEMKLAKTINDEL